MSPTTGTTAFWYIHRWCFCRWPARRRRGWSGQQTASGTNPNWDSPDGLATAEGLYSPVGVYLDRQDTLYVGDAGNNRVVQFLKPAVGGERRDLPGERAGGAGMAGVAVRRGADGGDTSTVSATTWPTIAAQPATGRQRPTASADLLHGAEPGELPGAFELAAGVGPDRRAHGGHGRIGGGRKPAGVGGSAGNLHGEPDGERPGGGSQPGRDDQFVFESGAGGIDDPIYGTGQGQVSPAVTDGTAAPSSPPLSSTVAVPTSNGTTCLNNQPSMCVAIGSGFGDVKYSGLAPGVHRAVAD